MISAQTARNFANLNKHHSELFLDMLKYIEKEAIGGGVSCNFCTGGKHISDDELDFVGKLGYEISWNSPCLWYEISWKDYKQATNHKISCPDCCALIELSVSGDKIEIIGSKHVS